MMKILVTGFEPFGEDDRNPSWEAVRRLPDSLNGAAIVKYRLPVSFEACGALLEDLFEKEKPDCVLSVGLAGGDRGLSMERVGINLMEARIPDNDGRQPFDQPIREDGENAYFSTLPMKRIAKAVKELGIEANVSYSAGTFVCNAVLYHILYLAGQRKMARWQRIAGQRNKEADIPPHIIRCGFIHVPYDEILAAGKTEKPPFMALSDMVRALNQALCVITGGGEEIGESAGTLN